MSSPSAALKPFLREIQNSLKAKTFQRMILSRPLTSNTHVPTKVTIRPIEINGETRYQWAERVGPREMHQNLTAGELVPRVGSTLGELLGDGRMFTTDREISVRAKGRGQFKLQNRIVEKTSEADDAEQKAEHNRARNYLIPADVPCPFLVAAGVMTADGQVKPTMYHKFRQINRYLELVQDVLPSLPRDGELRVVDFGCGKSYLTFALYHLLTKIHHRDVLMTGLDVRPDVIETCKKIARDLHLDGLSFEVGRIADVPEETVIDLAVSLHACDTATDESLLASVNRRAKVILAVPCCQHEVRPQLRSEPLVGLLKHGILAERLAADVTDALRGLWLEQQGYDARIIEFIELEHTPKNLLLRAVRRPQPLPAKVRAATEEMQSLKSLCGLDSTWLERHQGGMTSGG